MIAVAAQATLNFFAGVELLGESRALLLKLLNAGLALATLWALIYLALRRLPTRPPPRRPTLLVATLSTFSLATLLAVFNGLFRIEKYQAIYGALGGVVFILIGAFAACLVFYFWAQFLYAIAKVDVAALEKLFLAGEGVGANRLEALVFARANRLLAKYGRAYAPGDSLIREGDADKDAIFLYAGRVGVYKRADGGDRKLAEIGEGSLIGEMAHLLDEPRTASVRAETEVTALVLPPALLEELMRYSAPLSRRIIGTLAERLMRMNRAG